MILTVYDHTGSFATTEMDQPRQYQGTVYCGDLRIGFGRVKWATSFLRNA